MACDAFVQPCPDARQIRRDEVPVVQRVTDWMQFARSTLGDAPPGASFLGVFDQHCVEEEREHDAAYVPEPDTEEFVVLSNDVQAYIRQFYAFLDSAHLRPDE